MTRGPADDESCTNPLGRCSILYYGVGHMLNDITSACWFTYLLVFLTDIGLPPRDAAVVMLSGQIADGFTTIFAVSHMSMVANLSLYAVAFVIFQINSSGSVIDVEIQYRWIAYSSILIGCCFVGVFHLGTAEPRLKREAHEKGHARISWTYWFNKLLYYQVALVYVLTRLITNVSQAFLAFYVINDLQMNQSSKALVPAVIYICSFIVSVLLQEITWNGWRLKAFYSVGGLLWIISGGVILFLPSSMRPFMYILSIVIGVANALIMSMTRDIGLPPRDAAVVMLSGQIADGFTTIFAGELFSHMSMSPVANLSLYAVAFVIFQINSSGSVIDVEIQYRWIAYSSILIGCCFVGVFHLGTAEPRLKREAHEKGHARISWTYWFNKLLYYQVALVYVLTRLITNVSQAFLAFYVINDLQMNQSSKALVPAVIYICSFIVSVLLQEITWNGWRLKAFYSVGGLLWIISGGVILFLPSSMRPFMYILSIVIGVANALIMVSGVSMQSFLVGEDLNGCAFVYGSLSFFDKILCGLALSVLESYQSSIPEVRNSHHPIFFFSVTRYGLSLVPAICAFLGVIVTLTMELPEPNITPPLMDPLLA
ncbi:hypothetical protein OROGR_031813 [Orobanche gracilis]